MVKQFEENSNRRREAEEYQKRYKELEETIAEKDKEFSQFVELVEMEREEAEK